jgi:hypothetical protein
MDNKYNLPESWSSDISDSNKQVTITFDRLQLRYLMDLVPNGCVNELVSPVIEAAHKAISDAYWKEILG